MPSPRPEVVALSSCYHGGPNYAEFEHLGIDPADVLDFSSNSNPYPFKLDFKLEDVVIDHYPDSDSAELRRALAAQNGLMPENVIVGAGSMEIIRLTAQSYFNHGDKVLIFKPTFGEYDTACRIAGAEVVEFWTEEMKGFNLDLDRAIKVIEHLKPRAIFICNPNNPTGRYLSIKNVEQMLGAAGHGLVVLDEAYIAFTQDPWKSVSLISHGNLIVVRSMTKDFALAGLRLGYGLACQGIIENLNKVKPPWNVNAIAQKAGLQATHDVEYISRSEGLIRTSRDYLLGELGVLRFKLVPTQTNFFLMKVGKAREFRSALMRQGIVVRDCSSFGLPEYVRIAPRTLPECKKLVEAVRSLTWRLDKAFCLH
ncbi:pyridoxal phosphate-dependent aminotransferase [Dehalogenimonas etheniformans]|uniref:Aminotransferase n=1 Tax=Dehalogenimonas etheniformans TaxID=1536648 RepID=A0A2P5P9E2_9CHLR|nr:histidinol-phosphate transaminase [Dehalogenimonas etheniformans]PPD58916.1 histidinol-phosphate aminotransferase family protein [Dehalogenimonas etheniformans]QNT76318.1 histidinol-phosphate aminotransferase family protein [Dehalogenimonas etheniformans]